MFRFSLSSKAKTQLQKTLQQLSFLCAIYAAGIFTPAAAIPTLSFNIPAQGFSQNSTTKVDLVVSGLETPAVNLKGFSFDVLFDTNALDLISFSFGDTLNDPAGFFTPFVQKFSVNQNKASVSEVSLKSNAELASQPDSFLLGSFEFLGKSVGNSILAFSQVKIGNENNRTVSVVTQDSPVNVTGTSVPLPTTVVLFLTALMGLFVSRKYAK
jgi:hypothetical protein